MVGLFKAAGGGGGGGGEDFLSLKKKLPNFRASDLFSKVLDLDFFLQRVPIKNGMTQSPVCTHLYIRLFYADGCLSDITRLVFPSYLAIISRCPLTKWIFCTLKTKRAKIGRI